MTYVTIKYIYDIQQWYIQHITRKSEWIRKRCLQPLASTPHDCMRVLITSSGVVTNAAGTPAISPATKSSSGPAYIPRIWCIKMHSVYPRIWCIFGVPLHKMHSIDPAALHMYRAYDVYDAHMRYAKMYAAHTYIRFLYIRHERNIQSAYIPRIWCIRGTPKIYAAFTDYMHSTYSSRICACAYCVRDEYIECICIRHSTYSSRT